MTRNQIAATDHFCDGLCFGSPNKKEYVIWDFGILLFNLILFILGLRLRGFAASLKKTQVQGQSSPERRLSEEQKEQLKKQVSIWAEGPAKI